MININSGTNIRIYHEDSDKEIKNLRHAANIVDTIQKGGFS